MKSVKRDTHAVWFKHLPKELSKQLEELEPNDTVDLIINGHNTTWARMRSSSMGPTLGLRLGKGRTFWETIPMGETFTIDFAVAGAGNSFESPERTEVPVLRRLLRDGPMFDGYEFADFSGARDTASQRRSIRMAVARNNETPQEIGQSFTRETLQSETLHRLEKATEQGLRLAFGRDHQYSIPMALAHEVGLSGKTWRQALESLVRGSYGGPPLEHPSEFARKFNDWLTSMSRPQYFFSCSKARQYRIPAEDPRRSRFSEKNPTTYRLTELCEGLQKCVPKPLNRIGDNGTVGGQTIVGLVMLCELMQEAERRNIPVAVWPFDGLDVYSAAYERRHVMFEPYPSSVRDPDVIQTDSNDAVACVLCLQQADQADKLGRLLDLRALTEAQQTQVLFEGWIVGYSPLEPTVFGR